MTQKFRRALRALAIATAAMAVLGRPVAGQSLAEIAKKEEERRKAVKATAPAKSDKDKGKTQKTLTNKDLVPTEPGTPPPAAQATPSAPEGQPQAPTHSHGTEGKPESSSQHQAPAGSQAPAPSDAGAARDEKYWRSRMVTARGNLQRQELFLEALQSRVNALTTDFVNRDDPAQRAQIAADRQKALAEMEAVRKEIEQAKKQIADLEEEARKAGVPPGWLR